SRLSADRPSLQTVLDTLVQSAARLCEAHRAAIARQDGEKFRQVASFGYTSELDQFMAQNPVPTGRGSISGRLLLAGKAVKVLDVQAVTEYEVKDASRIGDLRTMLGVPLLRKGSPIGVLVLSRTTVQAFTDKQIELVETFADQAVIAIENTRLLNELRQSLEQQTATSEVLGVISSSPGELEPVFQTILENATQICEAKFGILWLYDAETFRVGALRDVPEEVAARGPVRPGPLHPLARLVATKQIVHISDYAEDAAYKQRDPLTVKLIELAGARTLIEVPMLKEGELIGAIAIYRQEVRPFTDNQIALVQNFAAQAVIAIENARLLNELRQRTDDLSEALERQ